MTFNTMKIL